MSVMVFFALLFFFIALRSEVVGSDTLNYKEYFNACIQHENYQFIVETNRIEPGFAIYMYLFTKISRNFQLFLAFTALISIVPIAFFYKHYSRNGMFSILIFVTFGLVSIYFSAVRQALAMAFVWPAFTFVRKRKLLPFLLTVALAFTFHMSSLVMLLMYPLYYIKTTPKALPFILLIVVAVMVCKERLFSSSIAMLGEKYEKLYGLTETTGAKSIFIMDVLFLLFAFIIPDQKKLNRQQIGMRNFLILIPIIQAFASVSNIAMRLNYYYLLFLPILLPRLVLLSKVKYRQFAKVAYWVMCGFFFVYYIYSVVSGTLQGNDVMAMYPYRFLWQ